MPRAYAALLPLAFLSFDLRGYDVIISSSSYFAKGIRKPPGSLHLCYCHSPANFLWRPDAYLSSAVTRAATAPLRAWLKRWDRWAAARPDAYMANGEAVAARIRSFYRRDATVVAPPIGAEWFIPHQANESYLVAGRLVAPKRIDLAIAACERLGVPLTIAGDGREAERLRQLAGPTVRFTGPLSDAELRRCYARAIALLVPAEEDFGMVPVEAQAAGTPVIAYDRGGARESVVDGLTGLRFSPQTARALAAAIGESARRAWDEDAIRSNAGRFDERHFRERVTNLVDRYAEPSPARVPAASLQH